MIKRLTKANKQKDKQTNVAEKLLTCMVVKKNGFIKTKGYKSVKIISFKV